MLTYLPCFLFVAAACVWLLSDVSVTNACVVCSEQTASLSFPSTSQFSQCRTVFCDVRFLSSFRDFLRCFGLVDAVHACNGVLCGVCLFFCPEESQFAVCLFGYYSLNELARCCVHRFLSQHFEKTGRRNRKKEDEPPTDSIYPIPGSKVPLPKEYDCVLCERGEGGERGI